MVILKLEGHNGNIAVNPNQISCVSNETSNPSFRSFCRVSFSDGKYVTVQGTVDEVCKKLSSQ